ncbi:MAG: bifunctional phosphopantothenoylcysteine decarboxylase/phosphopantothenate--cysteine ligase CoaBC, partial [Candidatus Korarchaeota archaeon]|nr:bifunctional phosphopantothenoylcysteine decarboxylase/phosphopantothenate--cysteine ligase CoaBC [Candidatus Korarchaeota archaeon]
PRLFEWATGKEALCSFRGTPSHIDLLSEADILIVAPATANTIAKMAAGIADTSVSLAAQTAMGLGLPVMVAPAMNLALYRSPAVKRALKELRSLGVVVVEPLVEEGKAKYPPVDELVWRAEALVLRGMDLAGRRILVTAGPTREYMDPVRFLSNPSSGRMGVYLALEAAYRGAEVTLIHGPLCVEAMRGPRATIAVETTEEMLNAVLSEAEEQGPDEAIFAAAPADYGGAEESPVKMPSQRGPIPAELRPTPKIIDEFRRRVPGALVVGFAAETAERRGELLERARTKMETHHADILVANNVLRRDAGFASEYSDAVILGPGDRIEDLGVVEKKMLARRILD